MYLKILEEGHYRAVDDSRQAKAIPEGTRLILESRCLALRSGVILERLTISNLNLLGEHPELNL